MALRERYTGIWYRDTDFIVIFLCIYQCQWKNTQINRFKIKNNIYLNSKNFIQITMPQEMTDYCCSLLKSLKFTMAFTRSHVKDDGRIARLIFLSESYIFTCHKLLPKIFRSQILYVIFKIIYRFFRKMRLNQKNRSWRHRKIIRHFRHAPSSDGTAEYRTLSIFVEKAGGCSLQVLSEV